MKSLISIYLQTYKLNTYHLRATTIKGEEMKVGDKKTYDKTWNPTKKMLKCTQSNKTKNHDWHLFFLHRYPLSRFDDRDRPFRHLPLHRPVSHHQNFAGCEHRQQQSQRHDGPSQPLPVATHQNRHDGDRKDEVL